MKIEDCLNDPDFRVAFIENTINGLNDIIKNNKGIIYHHNGYINILQEIKLILDLNDEELFVINKQIEDLEKENKKTNSEINDYKIMIDIYNRFLKFKKN